MTARSWLNTLLTRPARATRPARPAPARTRLGVESLEDRAVPAAVTSALAVGGAYGDVANDIAVDAVGNTHLTGYVSGLAGETIDFDRTAAHANNADCLSFTNTGSRAFVAKYAADGSFLWVRGFDGSAGHALAIDGQGNVCVTGYFNGQTDFDPGPAVFTLTTPSGGQDLFVLKLTGDGAFGWAKQVGSSNFYTIGSDITVDSTGAIYTTGYARAINNASESRIVVTRHDSEGGDHWVRQIGNNSISQGAAITTDGSHVFLTGIFHGTVDFDPGSGTYNLASGGSKAYPNQAAFVLKLTTAGGFAWAKHFQTGSGGSSSGSGIALDSQKNVYVTGGFRNTVDFDPGKGTYKLISGNSYLAKLSGSGQFLWAKGFGGYAEDLARDATGNLYVTGHFSGTVDFNPGSEVYSVTSAGEEDVYVLKLNDAGNFVWAVTLGGSAKDVPTGIAVDGAGTVSVVGYFKSPSLDGTSLTNNSGEEDLFLVKLK